jgi:hypothetical protein
MPGPDPGHWLHRLTASEWLAAADTELTHARAALERRATRPGVTHARRAAGMAWNAVLIGAPDARAGRSYMDHVVALAADDAAAVPDDVRFAARVLRDTPARPPELIAIGKPDLSALDAAHTIVAYARRLATR